MSHTMLCPTKTEKPQSTGKTFLQIIFFFLLLAQIGWQTPKVYNLLGNEVVTLVNVYKPTESYEVEFNLSTIRQGTSSINHRVSSGVCLCRLQTKKFSQTIKMLYLK